MIAQADAIVKIDLQRMESAMTQNGRKTAFYKIATHEIETALGFASG